MNGPARGGVLVLTALDLEYQAVRAHLSGLREYSHPAGTLFETGQLPDGGRITLAVTGEGNPGAAVLAERAITMFGPQAVMFVGVAGSLKDDVGLGDIVVGTKIYAYHGGAEADDGFLARPRAFEAAHELEQPARRIARTGSWASRLGPGSPAALPTVHFKPIAAGEVLLNSRDAPLARQLRRTYQDAAAIEMESAGLSQASHLNRGLPAITIRGISDRADSAKHAADEAGWQPRAAAHAAAFAVTLAEEVMARSTAGPGEPSAPRAGATQNITAHQGGAAYGVFHGNMYLNEQAGRGPAAADDPPGPDGAACRSPA